MFVGWMDLIDDDLVELGCKMATFDSMSAHVSKRSRRHLKDCKIVARIGPPNGTDLWQSNDQLTNKYFRKIMRREITNHALRHGARLLPNGKIPRPTNGQFVMMVARSIAKVNKLYSKRKDVDGEIVSTPVVTRSWELAGWIKGKPVNRKLADIMEGDYSSVDQRSAISRIYSKSYATRLPEPSAIPNVRRSSLFFSLVCDLQLSLSYALTYNHTPKRYGPEY